MDIEVEIRAFISKDKYQELIDYFSKNGKLTEEDEQETHYFEGDKDVRIQKAKSYSKIWMKEGKIHDDAREEIEVKTNRDDFPKLEKIFRHLGHGVEIKWFRKRHTFEWDEISVMIDYTKGYGYIIELEKITTENKKDETLLLLREKLKKLGIKETPKEVFKEKYENYKKNWKELIKEKIQYL